MLSVYVLHEIKNDDGQYGVPHPKMDDMEKKHKHHVNPRHKGGTDDPDNIIELDFIEHARIHAERFLSGQDGWFDCRHEGWPYLSENLRELVKKRMGEINRQNTGERHGSFGRNIHSQEFRARRSMEMMGEGNPMYGRERPDVRERLLNDPPSKRPEVREKIRQSALGRVMSEETKRKISASNKGKPKSLEMRQRLSASLTGKKRAPWTDEQKERHKEAMKRAWETRRNKNVD